MTSMLAKTSSEVFWAHPDPSFKDPRANFVAATAENLPFEPMLFDAVTIHDWLPRINPELALPQMARVLRPGGRLGISTLARDDSVPWVRRFVTLLRTFDPMAMAGRYGESEIDHVRRSRYFGSVEQRKFRVWQPIARTGLLDLVAVQPLASKLNHSQLSALLDEVGRLYDDSARPSEDLMLPFQLICWRTQPIHDELTSPIRRVESGLRIKL